MATPHFVKPGRKPNGERVSTHHEVSVEVVAKQFPTTKASWSVTSPTSNEGRVTNDFEAYQRVVLEVEPSETYGHFDKPGFYTLVGIIPKMASERLDLIGPAS